MARHALALQRKPAVSARVLPRGAAERLREDLAPEAHAEHAHASRGIARLGEEQTKRVDPAAAVVDAVMRSGDDEPGVGGERRELRELAAEAPEVFPDRTTDDGRRRAGRRRATAGSRSASDFGVMDGRRRTTPNRIGGRAGRTREGRAIARPLSRTSARSRSRGRPTCPRPRSRGSRSACAAPSRARVALIDDGKSRARHRVESPKLFEFDAMRSTATRAITAPRARRARHAPVAASRARRARGLLRGVDVRDARRLRGRLRGGAAPRSRRGARRVVVVVVVASALDRVRVRMDHRSIRWSRDDDDDDDASSLVHVLRERAHGEARTHRAVPAAAAVAVRDDGDRATARAAEATARRRARREGGHDAGVERARRARAADRAVDRRVRGARAARRPATGDRRRWSPDVVFLAIGRSLPRR